MVNKKYPLFDFSMYAFRWISCLSLLFIVNGFLPDKASAAGNNSDKNIFLPQQVTISGKVTDRGTPLPGISVKIKGTSTGVITNEKGEYHIDANRGDILVFTAIGYLPEEVKVGNTTRIDVLLSVNVSQLEKVVVVGYGTQKKINLTGAVSTVNFKELENMPQANTLNMLSGRVPGVSIVQPGGQPGVQDPEVMVRGIGTLNDAQPLVIIDGVQSELADLGNLAPQEIAEVSVLKDASSAAIYGARGANGVILVTTKNPKSGRMKVSLSSYYAIQQPTYLSKNASSWKWLTLQNEASASSTPEREQAIEQLKNGIYTDTASNTDWINEIFNSAPMQNYNLSISGGTDQLSFQGSLGYLHQDGILLNTSSKRYNFRSNVKAKISDIIEAGLQIWGYHAYFDEPFAGAEGVIDKANKATPLMPVRWSNGDWAVYNPLAYGNGALVIQNPVLLSEIGYTKDTKTKATLQTYLEIKPLKNLSIRTAINYTYGFSFRERFNPTFAYPAQDGVIAYSNNQNQVINNTTNTRQLQIQTIVQYHKGFGKDHELTLLGGHEYTQAPSWVMNAQGRNMPSNDAPVLNRVLDNILVGGSKNEWRLQSFFGRLNYVFKDRYLLEGDMRIDGSSRFPTANKYGYFPSFSAGWIISKEKLFKRLVPGENVVNLIKLRGGIGKVGNDRIGNYSYDQVFGLDSYYNFGNAVVSGGSISSFANPNIRWESTTTRDIGIDLGLLKNRLSISFDKYTRYTHGILYRLPLPPSFGVTTAGKPAILNIGEVSNKGWELEMSYRNQIKKIRYNIGFNISYVKNKIEKLNTREAIVNRDLMILREKEAINSYYGYVFEGVYRTQEDLDTYPPFTTRGLKLGAMKFKDVNSDGKITPDDRVVLGTSNTPYIFGINGGVSFQGFDMSFLFQGVKDKMIYVRDANNQPGSSEKSNLWTEWWDNRFDPEANPDGTWPVIRRTAPETEVVSSFWLRDASYIRLKNLELGYTFSKTLLGRTQIQNVRIYLSGLNLFTFSNLIKQVDPERPSLSWNNRGYPQTKIYSFGVNANF